MPYIEIYFKSLIRNSKKDLKFWKFAVVKVNVVAILENYQDITFADISKNSLDVIKKTIVLFNEIY